MTAHNPKMTAQVVQTDRAHPRAQSVVIATCVTLDMAIFFATQANRQSQVQRSTMYFGAYPIEKA